MAWIPAMKAATPAEAEIEDFRQTQMSTQTDTRKHQTLGD